MFNLGHAGLNWQVNLLLSDFSNKSDKLPGELVGVLPGRWLVQMTLNLERTWAFNLESKVLICKQGTG